MKEKMEEKKTKFGDRNLVAGLGAAVCAVVVFIVMLVVKSHIINAVDTVPVIVAAKDVPVGIVLTKENIATYFSLEERATSELPKGAFTSGNPLVGKVTAYPLVGKQILTDNFLVMENLYEGIEDPVEISLELAKIGQAVGGTLRAGDRINLLLVTEAVEDEEEVSQEDIFSDIPEIEVWEETDADGAVVEEGQVEQPTDSTVEAGIAVRESASGNASKGLLVADNLTYSVTGDYACATVAENIRITQAFNSAGQTTEELAKTETSQVATVVNIVIPKRLEGVICLAQEEGTLRLSRVVESGPVAEPADNTVNVMDGIKDVVSDIAEIGEVLSDAEAGEADGE